MKERTTPNAPDSGADVTGPERLWGGGFAEPMHPALVALSVSLEQDRPLAAADLAASAAWAEALGRAGVLNVEEVAALVAALRDLSAALEAKTWRPEGAEDIHGAIEAELTRRLGEAAGRLHTGRSRNDQVATAFRLAVADRLDDVRAALRRLQAAFVERAEQHIDTLLPALTHFQRAQPMRLAHWLLAHFWALERDAERLAAARARALHRLPLGSGAVSGTPYAVDRAALARALGFTAPSENSLDAVGDRDFAVEAVFGLTLTAIHLSRLGEDLVVWSSAEFGWLLWPDGLATGSSLMPNKKNPDLAELVRGKSAALLGQLTTLLALLKGLPSSYQRDLQEDKPPVWQSLETVELCLNALTAALQTLEFRRERMSEALSDDVLATEMADALVAQGVPFRQAHHLVSRAAAAQREQGGALAHRLAETLAADGSTLTLDAFDALSAVERRAAPGGTARSAVLNQLGQARAALAAGGEA